MCFSPREELETEGTPGRNTWGRWSSMRIRSLFGLGDRFGVGDLEFGIWGEGEGESAREGEGECEL